MIVIMLKGNVYMYVGMYMERLLLYSSYTCLSCLFCCNVLHRPCMLYLILFTTNFNHVMLNVE